MNLYNLHDHGDKLHHNEIAHDHVPLLIVTKYGDSLDALKKHKDKLANDPNTAVFYATLTGKKFLKAEKAISTDAECSLEYAKHILNYRFPKGEPAIAQDARCSFIYARDVLQKEFKLGERTIAKSPFFSWQYASFVLNGPFKEGESTIAKDPEYSYRYAKDVLRSRFYEGENAILQSEKFSVLYMTDVLTADGSKEPYQDFFDRYQRKYN